MLDRFYAVTLYHIKGFGQIKKKGLHRRPPAGRWMDKEGEHSRRCRGAAIGRSWPYKAIV